MSLDINAMTPEALRLEVQRRIERRAKGLPLMDEEPGKIRQRHNAEARPVLERAIWIAYRDRPEWRICLFGPPRTKKNSTTLGIRQSAAYRKWCADVVDQINASNFVGPIPDAVYNLSAWFFVDNYGKRADLIGLLQGLADALEAAKVVSDDKWFLGFDGSRKYEASGDGDIINGQPRVELCISLLGESHK